jgi:transglutaminase-like putative cysteine protease
VRISLSPISTATPAKAAFGSPPRWRSPTCAARWRAEELDEGRLVQRALAMFRDHGFTYTLSPPLLEDDTVDGFLFGTRAGFCEHFSSAFVVLMRALDIPARVVTGYQGGQHNPAEDYWIVRQSDAHAWAEVWLGDRGWVRVDPTGAVAPERILRGAADSGALSGAAAGATGLASLDFLAPLRLSQHLAPEDAAALSRPALFDLARDPHERADLAGRYPDVVASLLAVAEQARSDTGDHDRTGAGVRFFDPGPRPDAPQRA